jgi:hypothetical protein
LGRRGNSAAHLFRSPDPGCNLAHASVLLSASGTVAAPQKANSPIARERSEGIHHLRIRICPYELHPAEESNDRHPRLLPAHQSIWTRSRRPAPGTFHSSRNQVAVGVRFHETAAAAARRTSWAVRITTRNSRSCCRALTRPLATRNRPSHGYGNAPVARSRTGRRTLE